MLPPGQDIVIETILGRKNSGHDPLLLKLLFIDHLHLFIQITILQGSWKRFYNWLELTTFAAFWVNSETVVWFSSS